MILLLLIILILIITIAAVFVLRRDLARAARRFYDWQTNVWRSWTGHQVATDEQISRGEVTVTLTADVSGFIDGMSRASASAAAFDRRLKKRDRRQKRRRWVVVALEATCTVLDKIPTWAWNEGRVRRFYGGWGCRLGLARRSAELDERWGTGEWGEAG